MIIFNSDLDNTLIYSYKHEIGAHKKCVELYEGREISYMTLLSLELLERIRQRVLFVPVTTRTVEQYRRIRLGMGEPPYALVCNGGVLLVNGREDDAWYEETVKRIGDCGGELRRAQAILEHDPDRDFEVRLIRELFLFTKSKAPEQTMERLRAALDPDKMDVLGNGVKVYAVPKALNKGAAVLRLKERLGANKVIASGDSEFDIPMLDAADLAIAPKSLADQALEHADYIYMPGEKVFSEEMLDCVLQRILTEG